MIEIEAPDGSIVEFPDGTPDNVINDAMRKTYGGPEQQQQAQPQAQQPGIGMDMLRSAGTGVRQGLESMAGMFGDVNQMTGDIAGWAAGKMGAGLGMQSGINALARNLSPTAFLPKTQDIKTLTNAAVGENYEPQTMPGQFARTVGQFVPAAAAGPGSLMRKGAMAVVPGVMSEAAGQMTKGSEAEPYARLAGGLAGGLAAGMTRAPKLAQQATQSADELGAEATKLFNQMRASGAYLPGKVARNAKANISFILRGTNKELSPTAYGLKAQADKVLSGNKVDIVDYHNLSMLANAAARSKLTGTDAHYVGKVKQFIDSVRNATPIGPVKQWQKANTLVLRQHKVAAIDKALDLADLATGQYSQAQLAHTVAQKFRELYKSQDISMFNAAEKNIIREIGKGQSYGAVVNGLRKLAPRGIVSAALGAGVLGSMFPGGNFIVPALGEAAQRVADKSVMGAAQSLRNAAGTGLVPQPLRQSINGADLVKRLALTGAAARPPLR